MSILPDSKEINEAVQELQKATTEARELIANVNALVLKATSLVDAFKEAAATSSLSTRQSAPGDTSKTGTRAADYLTTETFSVPKPGMKDDLLIR
jgi:signal transduction histidine kinase